ncbi:MAG: hypothetical protein K6E29_08275 [Cyanobacteria bacterium RUI128]|nr:hypothetical protein [Cyanobacteria bacterium RUI128]
MGNEINPQWLGVRDFTQDEKSHGDYNQYAKKYDSSLYAGDLTEVTTNVDTFRTDRESMNLDTTLSQNQAYSGISFEDDPTLKSFEADKGRLSQVLTQQETAYKAVLLGANPELSAKKADVEVKQKAYIEALEKDAMAKGYAEPLKVVLQEINQTEKSIADYKTEQTNYEGEDEKLKSQISSLDTEINGYTTQIGVLENSISGYETQMSSLKGQKRTIRPDSDTKADDEAFNARLQSQINALDSKKRIAEGQKAEYERSKTSAEEKKEQCKAKQNEVADKIEAIKQQIQTEEDNLTRLNEQKETIEGEINKYAGNEVKTAMEEYNRAKADYDSAYERAVKEASDKVNDTRAQITELDGKIAARKQELLVIQKQKEAEEKAKAEEEARTNAEAATASSDVGASGSGGSGGIGGGGASGGVGAAGGAPTLQQLQQAVTDAKTELNTAKDDLFSALDGTHNELKQSKAKQELSFTTFIETLQREDSAMAATIKATKKALTAKENELAQVNKDLIQADLTAGDNSVVLQRAEFDLAELKDSQTKMNEVNESELDADKKNELNEMKQKVAKAIQDKEAEITNLRTGASANKAELEGKKSRLENEVVELKNKLKDQMQTAANRYASVASAQKAYNDAVLEYDSKRDALISSKTNDLTTASTKYKEAAETSAKEEAKDFAKDYRFANSDTTIQPGTLKGKLAGKEDLVEQLCQKYGIKDVKFVGAILGVEHSFGRAQSGVGVSCNNYLSYRAAGDTGMKNGNGFGIFSSVDAGLEAGIRNLAAYTSRYNIPEISIDYVDQIGAHYCDAEWSESMRRMYSQMA